MLLIRASCTLSGLSLFSPLIPLTISWFSLLQNIHIAMESFQQWLHSCFQTGYLKEIIINESHDILLSQDYCNSFCSFTSLGSIGCQLVLLSAMISPSVEVMLWKVSYPSIGNALTEQCRLLKLTSNVN